MKRCAAKLPGRSKGGAKVMTMPQDSTAAPEDDVHGTDADGYDALIRESAASYVETSATLARARAQAGADHIDRTHWRELADLGWLSLAVPEAHGGAGLGMTELVVLLEELGKGLLPEPLALCGVLPARAAAHCEGPAAMRLIEDIISGGQLASVAWQGKPGILSADETSIEITPQPHGFTLEGSASFVAAAESADVFLAAARSHQGVGLYRVARTAAGISITSSRAADGSHFGHVRFDGVMLPAEAQIGRPGEGRAALDVALDETRVALSAEMLGATSALFQRTLDYLRIRKQFGRALGSFQVLQHRVVDLYVEIELSRAAITRAARTLDATAADPHAAAAERAAAASACKARLSDTALHVAREAVQLHGAIGYTDEHDVGLYLNHALVRSAMLGNAPTHRRRFGALTAKLRAA
jgi:3-oxochol-4-en-24-oyl-CoA dehydrogenase